MDFKQHQRQRRPQSRVDELKRLSEEYRAADVEKKVELLEHLRQAVESISQSEQLQVLQAFWPSMTEALTNTEPQFEENPIFYLRLRWFEVLTRFSIEVLAKNSSTILYGAMDAVERDNEEVATVAIKLVSHAIRAQRGVEFSAAVKMFQIVEGLYSRKQELMLCLRPEGAEWQGEESKKLTPAAVSLRVLADSIQILLLMYNYARTDNIHEPMQRLLPKLLDFLSFANVEPSEIASDRTGAFNDLNSAKVKSLTVLAYANKVTPDIIQDSLDRIAEAVVGLLEAFPDSVNHRRDLLYACRNLVHNRHSEMPQSRQAMDLSQAQKGQAVDFYHYLGRMLNERSIVGPSRACANSLRPLAFSFIVESINQMRRRIAPEHLLRTTELLSNALFASDTTIAVQTQSTRLLYSFCDLISRRSDLCDADTARYCIDLALDTCTSRIEALESQCARLVTQQASSVSQQEHSDTSEQMTSLNSERRDEEADRAKEKSRELAACKNLLRMLTQAMKALTIALRRCSGDMDESQRQRQSTQSGQALQPQQAPSYAWQQHTVQGQGQQRQPQRPLTIREAQQLERMVSILLRSLAFLNDQELKEFIAWLPTTLHTMDERTLRDLLAMRMETIFDALCAGQHSLLSVISNLLQESASGKPTAEIVLKFIMERKFSCLDQPHSQAATVVVRLVNLTFNAVPKYPDGEYIVKPYMLPMVEKCLEGMRTASDMFGYVRTLRYLFRAIVYSKSSNLHKELVQALKPCIDTFLEAIRGPLPPDVRTIVIELSLMLPCQLSPLLPYLKYLQKPLLAALRSEQPELRMVGLRSLDFWIDSLKPEALDPLLCSYDAESDIISALWSLIRPGTSQAHVQISNRALQVIGKLGGRARRSLSSPPNLDYKQNPEHGLRLVLTFRPSTSFLIPLDRCVSLADSLPFLRRCLVPLLSLQSTSSALSRPPATALSLARSLPGQQPTLLPITSMGVGSGSKGSRASQADTEENDSGSQQQQRQQHGHSAEQSPSSVKTKTQLDAERSVLRRLLFSNLSADPSADSGQAGIFSRRICTHFALSFALGCSREISAEPPVASNEHPLLELNPQIFLEALASSTEGPSPGGIFSLSCFLSSLIAIAKARAAESKGYTLPAAPDLEIELPIGAEGEVGSGHAVAPTTSPAESIRPEDIAVHLPEVADQLIPSLLHQCYESDWDKVTGGVLAIACVADRMPPLFILRHADVACRAVMFALRTLPESATQEQTDAKRAIRAIASAAASTGVKCTEMIHSLANEVMGIGGEGWRAAQEAGQEAIEIVSKHWNTTSGLILQRADETMEVERNRRTSELVRTLASKPTLLQRPHHTKRPVVSGVSYFVSLEPPLADVGDSAIAGFLSDALKHAGSEILPSNSHSGENNTSTSVRSEEDALKAECMELIAKVINKVALLEPDSSSDRGPFSTQEYMQAGSQQQDAEQQQQQEPLVGFTVRAAMAFTQGLMSKHRDIYTAAKRGWHNLPEEVITRPKPSPVGMSQQAGHQGTSGTSPVTAASNTVLKALAMMRNGPVQVSFIEGFARVFEAFGSWALYTGLPEKIMDVLTSLTDASRPAARPDLAAAALDAMRYAPENSAHRFPASHLCRRVALLEESMPKSSPYSALSSPFREPLLSHLLTTPTESARLVRASLADEAVAPLLLDLMECKRAEPIIKDLAGAPEELERALAPAPDDSHRAQLRGARLVAIVLEWHGSIMAANPRLGDLLYYRWKGPEMAQRLKRRAVIHHDAASEPHWLARALAAHVRTQRSKDPQALIELVNALAYEGALAGPLAFVEEFVANEIPEQWSYAEQKTVLEAVLSRFKDTLARGEQAAIAATHQLRILVQPIVEAAAHSPDPSSVVSLDVVNQMVHQVFSEDVRRANEDLVVEALQLSTCMLRNVPKSLDDPSDPDLRREVLNFGWYICNDRQEQAVRAQALLNLAHFMATYQTSDELVMELFKNLLAASEGEVRPLTARALDVLVPALPRQPRENESMPWWVDHVKRCLADDHVGAASSSHAHALGFLHRHEHLFYAERHSFVRIITNSLGALGLVREASAEFRRLSLELVRVMIRWERRATGMEQADAGFTGSDGDGEGAHKRKGDHDDDGGGPRKAQRVEYDQPVATIDSGQGQPHQAQTQSRISLAAVSGGGPTPPDIIGAFLCKLALHTAEGNTVAQQVQTPQHNQDKQRVFEYGSLHRQAMLALSEFAEVWPNSPPSLDVATRNCFGSNGAVSPIHLGTSLEIASRLLSPAGAQAFRTRNKDRVLILLDPASAGNHLPVQKPATKLAAGLAQTEDPNSIEEPVIASIVRNGLRELSKTEQAQTQQQGSSAQQQQQRDQTAWLMRINYAISLCKAFAQKEEELHGKSKLLWSVLPDLNTAMESLIMELSQERHRLIQQRKSFHDESSTASEGTLTSVVCETLELAAKQALASQSEDRRRFLKQFADLLSDRYVMYSGPVVAKGREIVCSWADIYAQHGSSQSDDEEQSKASATTLADHELIAFLQRISHIHRHGLGDSTRPEAEDELLGSLLRLIETDPNRGIGSKCFHFVERKFLIGLRARDANLRKRFFTIYDQHHITQTLVDRLRFIVNEQDWEPLSDRFWLKQALDLLLAILLQDEPIKLAPNAAYVPPVPAPKLERGGMNGDEDSKGDIGRAVGSEVEMMAKRQSEFANEASEERVHGLLEALQELANRDPNVSAHLWVLIFPIVWATLQKNEQLALAKPLISLLTKEHHHRAHSQRPNVVQALLEGISLSQPQPKIPSEVVKYLGKSFNVWHIAVPVLESHVNLFQQDPRPLEALAELYRHLGEEDVLAGLWRTKTQNEYTRSGLTLARHGFYAKAEEIFLQALQNNGSSNVHKLEICLWEHELIRAAKSLEHWDCLADFAKGVKHLDLSMESAFHLGDWNAARDATKDKTDALEESPSTYVIRASIAMREGYIQYAERLVYRAMQLALEAWWRLPGIGAIPHEQGLHNFQQIVEVQEALKAVNDLIQGATDSAREVTNIWKQRMPNVWEPLPLWSFLLSLRTQMYECIAERAQARAGESGSFNDLTATAKKDKAWHVQKLAAVARKQGEPEVALRLLNSSRAGTSQPSGTGHQHEVSEAFVKLTEQVKAHLAPDVEGDGEDPAGALTLLENYNLDYFFQSYKAELYRLRGEALHAARDLEGASTSYAVSVALFRQLGTAWINWGEHNDFWASNMNRQGNQYSEQGAHQAVQYFVAQEAKYREYAATCFLMGARHDAHSCRAHLARVLELLCKPDIQKKISHIVKSYHDQISPWAWLFHVPHLLHALRRPQFDAANDILMRLAISYPQGVYFPLRTNVLNLQNVIYEQKSQGVSASQHEVEQQHAQLNRQQFYQASSVGSESGQPQGSGTAEHAQMRQAQSHPQYMSQSGQAPSFFGHAQQQQQAEEGPQAAMHSQPWQQQQQQQDDMEQNTLPEPKRVFHLLRDILERLRVGYPTLLRELEAVLPDLTGQRFAASADERLHALLQTLVLRLLKHEVPTYSELPENMIKEMRQVAKVYFVREPPEKEEKQPQKYQEKDSKPQSPFLQANMEQMKADLDPDGENFPRTVEDLLDKLKAWLAKTQSFLDGRPQRMLLEQEAPWLVRFRPVELAVPGQLVDDREPPPNVPVRLASIQPSVWAVRRYGQVFRRIGFVGEDGKGRQFIITTAAVTTRAEDRLMHYARYLNGLLERHRDSRRRHLQWHTPASVPVWPTVRLLEESDAVTAYGEAYEVSCARYGREEDLPILHFRKKLDPAAETGENWQKTRKEAFEDITKLDGTPKPHQVSENVFTQYMYKTLPASNQLWAFKRQLCAQLALSGLLGCLLKVQARSPSKLLFSKSTARVYMVDFHPQFDPAGVLEQHMEPIWFRLTRNLSAFFTAFGVNGSFASTVAAAASSFLEPNSASSAHTALLFHDELLIFIPHLRKQVITSGKMRLPHLLAPPNPPPSLVRSLSLRRSSELLQRAKEISPTTKPPSNSNFPSVHQGVHKELQPSLTPDYLCRMEPPWQPWL